MEIENKNTEQQNIEQTADMLASENKYSHEETLILKYADMEFEQVNTLLNKLSDKMADAWFIKTAHDPEAKKVGPFDEYINMLQFYIDSVKARYAKYCQENGIAISDDLSKALDKKKQEEDRNKPAEVIKAKTIRKLIMG